MSGFRIVDILFPFVMLASTQSTLLVENHENACPEGYYLVRPQPPRQSSEAVGKTKCYKFFYETYTFQQAIETCESINSTLASPRETATADGLAHFIVERGLPSRRFWIGLTDRDEEGYLTWIDNNQPLSSLLPPLWLVQEPDSHPSAAPGSQGDQHDCVKMAIWVFGTSNSARWYDTLCESRESFICEADPLYPIDPPELPVTPSEENENMPPRPDNLGTLIDEHGNILPEESQAEEVDFVVPKPNVTTTQFGSIENEPMELIGYGNIGSGNDSEVSTDATTLTPDTFEAERNNTFNDNIGRQRTCNLQCSVNVIRAACPLAEFPELRRSIVVLNNATCRPRRNRTHLIIITTLDGCGTIATNTLGDFVSFTNSIRLITQPSTIIRDQQRSSMLAQFMALECRYPQRNLLVHNFIPEDRRPQVHFAIESGPTLPHVFLLYQSDEYECPFAREDYPVRISTSSRLNFEVRLMVATDQIELHPVTCISTPDNDRENPVNYVLMRNGCILDPTFEIETSDSPKVSRFSVQAFRFLGFFRTVYIHCELIVCAIGSESSPACPYECQEEDQQRRGRDVAEDNVDTPRTRRIVASMGPIIIVEDEEHSGGDSSQGQEGRSTESIHQVTSPPAEEQENNQEDEIDQEDQPMAESEAPQVVQGEITEDNGRNSKQKSSLNLAGHGRGSAYSQHGSNHCVWIGLLVLHFFRLTFKSS